MPTHGYGAVRMPSSWSLKGSRWSTSPGCSIRRRTAFGPGGPSSWRAGGPGWSIRPIRDSPRSSARLPSLLEEAICRSPQNYGFLSTVWSVRDLGTLLAHRYELQVCAATVYRALLNLGYRYRRPPRAALAQKKTPRRS
jgi:hypothetical protein